VFPVCVLIMLIDHLVREFYLLVFIKISVYLIIDQSPCMLINNDHPVLGVQGCAHSGWD